MWSGRCDQQSGSWDRHPKSPFSDTQHSSSGNLCSGRAGRALDLQISLAAAVQRLSRLSTPAPCWILLPLHFSPQCMLHALTAQRRLRLL